MGPHFKRVHDFEGRWSSDAVVSLELCMLTDRWEPGRWGSKRWRDEGRRGGPRALIKSIAKGFRGETMINSMFKRCFFLQRLWSFQNPEFQHWSVIDFKEVRVECVRITKNTWEKLVVLNTPRLLGPPGLPVISSPILLAFNAPLISGCLGFLKVMSYDYFHGLMLMMFVISCCLFICMYILILCSSIF